MVKFLLNATFSGVQLTESFLRERLHCENEDENSCNNSSGHYGVRSQVIQPFQNFSICFSHSKRRSNYIIELQKSLKRIPFLAYTEMKQTIHSFFTNVCIFGHCATY